MLSHSKTPKEASWVAYFGGLETPDAGIRHSKRQINIWLINDVSVYQKSVHRINHDTYTLKSVFLCFFFFFAAPLKLVDVSQPAMVCVCVCVRACTHTRVQAHSFPPLANPCSAFQPRGAVSTPRSGVIAHPSTSAITSGMILSQRLRIWLEKEPALIASFLTDFLINPLRLSIM